MQESTRRNFISVAATLAAAATPSDLKAQGPVTPAQGVRGFDQTDALLNYIKMRANPGERLGCWWNAGIMYGRGADDVVVPWLSIEGFSFMRIKAQADGTYQQLMSEAGYFGDPNTGTILDTWVNPENGIEIKLPHYKSSQWITLAHDGIRANPKNWLQFRGWIGPQFQNNGRLWVSENLVARQPNIRRDGQDPRTYTGPFINASSLATFEGATAELNDPEATFVNSSLSFSGLSSRAGWLMMGDAPGDMLWIMSGQKVRSPDDIPTGLRRRLDRDYPNFLTSPDM